MNKDIMDLNKEIFDWWWENKAEDKADFRITHDKLVDDNGNEFKEGKILNPIFIDPKINISTKVLFVGLNPSASAPPEAVFEDNDKSKEDLKKDFFGKNNTYEDFAKFFKTGWCYSRYFGPIIDILENVNKVKYPDERAHIDLFAIRGTDSKQVVKILELDGYSRNDKKHNPHISQGIKVFKRILEILKEVEVIIFNNIIASRMIYNHYKNNLKEDGLWYNLNLDGNDIKCYFQGIMGYGRLDTFQKERIIYLINEQLDDKS